MTTHSQPEASALDALLNRYPQLNTPQVSRRALLAVGSLLALDLTGCGSSDDATTGTVVNGGGGGGGGGSGNTTPAPTITSFTPSSGSTAGGTLVTINGTDLTGASAVTFGTTAASSFTVVSSTQITAATPARVVGPVQISVTTPGGTANASTQYAYRYANGGVVSTLAGSGTGIFANGTGTAASFYYPTGVAVDSSGNVYVGDQYTNRIRKITSAGVVSTFAGSGTTVFADGTGTAATFHGPSGVALDSSGNLYVADQGNGRIRKITSAGVVSTLAGSGAQAYADGTGTAASFHYPIGVAVDNSGNVYVADQNTNRIRKITSAGVVSTLAGSGAQSFADGTGTAASFNYPSGVAVDSSGNVYVADQNNNRIRMITPTGVVSTWAGSGSPASNDGTGTAASFNIPYGVAVDSNGYVYVAEAVSSNIRMVTPTGVVSTLAGSGAQSFADGTGTAASFNYPTGVALDSSGNVYVADFLNHRIRKIS